MSMSERIWDCTRTAGHRDQKTEAVGLLWDEPCLLSDAAGCDSVVVVGTTTSGCVRATVVDAFSLNYRVTLAEEGCFDRRRASHAVSLC
jgi:nicotinamidase-related amidase